MSDSHRGGLAAYVTSHGFGHLNRTVAVLNRVPADVPLTIRCRPDLFPHWRERLKRPARLESHTSDIGALNPAGDSAATDGPATLALAARVHAEAMAHLDLLADQLAGEGTAAVLCDAPAVPLVAARRAGVPGFLLANFTWADIYEPHARRIGPEAMAFVAELRQAYRTATRVFRTEPALRMPRVAADVEDVGLIVTPGRDRSAELRRRFKLGAKTKLVYLYVGRYGQANLGWERLPTFEDVHFVGFHPAPADAPPVPNLHVVPADAYTGADLAASADAVVAKAGYGAVGEAMVARTPFIYPPRTGFAEHRALDAALRAWGGGIPISARDFTALRIGAALKTAFALKPGPPPFPTDGARRVAAHLTAVCRAALERSA